MTKRYIIIGATSSIAHHCARIWAQRDKTAAFTLVCRSAARAEPIAADLLARNPQATAEIISLDFTDAKAIAALTATLAAQGPLDTVLIAHGTLPEQGDCERDLQLAESALIINGISPALFAESFAGHMQAANHGHLCIISSVAGERGRKSNYVYGAAKGLTTRYVEGLQHRLALASSNVKVTLVKPGPTATPMTAHLQQQGAKLASVESVAQQIVNATDAGKPVVYTPTKWALIMLVIRALPRFVFNKLDI